MTIRNRLIVAAALVTLLATSCSDDDPTTTVGDSTPTSEAGVETTTEPDAGTRVQRLWIAAETVPCEGVAPQICLQVAESEDGPFTLFYDGIEGFTHEPGTSSVIDVEITDVPDPPADASSVAYRLIEVVATTTG